MKPNETLVRLWRTAGSLKLLPRQRMKGVDDTKESSPPRLAGGSSPRLPGLQQLVESGRAEILHRTDCRENGQESCLCGKSPQTDRANAERRGCVLRGEDRSGP